jgi:hypothetical protein
MRAKRTSGYLSACDVVDFDDFARKNGGSFTLAARSCSLPAEHFHIDDFRQDVFLVGDVVDRRFDCLVVVLVAVAAAGGSPAGRMAGVLAKIGLAHPLENAANGGAVARTVHNEAMDVIGHDGGSKDTPSSLSRGSH